MAEIKSALEIRSLLGTGWSFPPRFVADAQGVVMTPDEADVDASLRILFGTALGERFMHPQYGLDLRELLFEPITTTAKTLLLDRIKTAVLVYEPRIKPITIEIDSAAQPEGKVALLLEYEIRATNSRYNLVYPLFKSDANDLRDLVDFNIP